MKNPCKIKAFQYSKYASDTLVTNTIYRQGGKFSTSATQKKQWYKNITIIISLYDCFLQQKNSAWRISTAKSQLEFTERKLFSYTVHYI